MKNKELTLDKIQKIRDDNNNKNIRIYEYIYTRIEFVIKQAVKNNKSSCNYTVPSYIVGFPVFDLSEAINYCMIKIKKNGLIPFLLNINTICVTWQVVDKHNQKMNNNNGNVEENDEKGEDDAFVNSLINYKIKTMD